MYRLGKCNKRLTEAVKIADGQRKIIKVKQKDGVVFLSENQIRRLLQVIKND